MSGNMIGNLEYLSTSAPSFEKIRFLSRDYVYFYDSRNFNNFLSYNLYELHHLFPTHLGYLDIIRDYTYPIKTLRLVRSCSRQVFIEDTLDNDCGFRQRWDHSGNTRHRPRPYRKHVNLDHRTDFHYPRPHYSMECDTDTTEIFYRRYQYRRWPYTDDARHLQVHPPSSVCRQSPFIFRIGIGIFELGIGRSDFSTYSPCISL